MRETDITKFSQEELCKAWDILSGWEWYEGFGEKPKDFDKMIPYRRTLLEKIFHAPARDDYISPLCRAIENVVPRKELLRYHNIHNLGKTNEEFETFWFLNEGGCFTGSSETLKYFSKLPGKS